MKKTNLINSRYSFLLSLGLLSFVVVAGLSLAWPAFPLVQSANAAGVENAPEQFAAHNPDSKTALNHDVFTTFLETTVLDVGRSKGRMGTVKPKSYRESHITFTSGKPSRYEGNRLFIHDFNDAHMEYLLSYKEGLEGFSAQRSLSSLNRDEQLAYWLNLYNVTVLIKMAEEYPIKSLKSLRMGSSKAQSYWQAKTVQVEGVEMSLMDIENILFTNWRDPLVLYGLYQGTIGGPSLMREAFSGANVWANLRENAREFVNSNRGVRPDGEKAQVSLIYKWGAAAYGNSDENLIRHIQDYADKDFLGDVSSLTAVKKKYYDWNIADMLGGTRHTGRHNQKGGLGIGQGPDSFLDVTANGMGGTSNLPPQALELLANIVKYNDIPRRTPVVTIEECDPGECKVADPGTEQ